MISIRRKKKSSTQIRWDKIIKDHTWLTISAIGEKPCSSEEITLEFMKFELTFGGGFFFFPKERDPSYIASKKMVENDIEFLLKEDFIFQENNQYFITEKGKEVVDYFGEKWGSVNRLANRILSSTAPPKASLVVHLLLGVLKLVGFGITGMVSLLGDGIDSAIDGLSSIIVNLSIRYKKEKYASYLLLFLMLFSGVGILEESIRRIIQYFQENVFLEQETFAVIVASISIVLCLFLYIYQRIVGYTRRNLTIIVQSEDSRNHILIGLLVLVSVIAGIYKFYIFDGIIGLFIGLLIFYGCLEVFKDIRALEKGNEIDFEKYKLGMWKRFERFRKNVVGTWIMYQISKGMRYHTNLEQEFTQVFQPQFLKIVKIELEGKDSKNFERKNSIKLYHDKETFQNQISILLEKKYITEDKNEYTLTTEGFKNLEKEYEKQKRRHKRHSKRMEKRLKTNYLSN